jgi:hypothetical protein
MDWSSDYGAAHAYIDAAGIAEDKKGFLFRTSRGHGGTALAEQPMTQVDAWRMVRKPRARRRMSAAPHSADRQSLLPRNRDHGLSRQRRHAGACSQWRRTRAREQPSSTTAPRSG